MLRFHVAEAEGRRRLPHNLVDIISWIPLGVKLAAQRLRATCALSHVEDADEVFLALGGGFEVAPFSAGAAPVDFQIVFPAGSRGHLE